ncbi:MAG TPA: uroporphyrinogen-III C-methyltransferase [Nevskiaceae bacterium]|nr:uroporphyrinogen-III C-methyltransferase [Nevskiaceae bacterium]
MTEPAPDAAPDDLAAEPLSAPRAAPVPPSRPPRSGLRWVGVVLWLVLMAALGLSGWAAYEWWQQHESLSDQVARGEVNDRQLASRITALETQGGEIATRQADLSRSANRNATDIAALQSSIAESQRLMGRISDELSGGRTRFQLAAIESLLIMAIDRLQLEHDAASALTALETADERLAAINDPRLFPVREAIAAERTALRAVPRADVASAALSLGSLIDRVPQLPLVAHAPSQFESPDVREAAIPATADMPAWRRILASVTTAAKSLFTIRRDDNSRSTRLLPPEQEAIVYQVLILELEGARVALLRGNTAAFRDELRSASSWLDREFKPDDPGVLAVRGEIERLRSYELSPPLPDIGRSLERLRSLLESTKP